MCWFTNPATVTIAAGVGRQVQQYVFADERREIDNLRALQFLVQGESGHFDFVDEFFEARHASYFHRLVERPAGPKPVRRNADVEIVVQRSGAPNPVRFQFRDWIILFTLEVQSFGRNLFQMNFHRANFFPNASATGPGTKSETLPPRRAISFTNRELR